MQKMKSKLLSSLFVIAALVILIYDLCAGEQIDTWIFLCVGLLVAAQFINIFQTNDKTSKTKQK